MRTATAAFAISTLGAGALTPVVRNLAIRRGVLDHALTSRKIHGRPVPRLGGVAIVAAFFLPLLALLFVKSSVGAMFRAEPYDVAGLFAGGIAIAALGIYDDVRGARARQKFLVQFAVGALMYAFGYRIGEIANPFGAPLPLGIFGLPVTMLWFAGVVNAMNLIDGIDGLAGGVALVAVGSTFAVAALAGDPLMMLFTATLAGAVLGFLRYNFNPASIFMGDTGSMFLGFVLAATSLNASQKSATAVALLAPVVALGLPIGDTLLAMGRRLLRGQPMFQGDREHIHHKLLAKGLSQRATALALYGVAAVLGLGGVLLSRAVSGWAALLVLALLVGAGALFLRWLGYVRLEKLPEVAELRRRNLELRARVREAGEALRRAVEPEQIWHPVRELAPAFGARCIGLTLVERDATGRKLTEYSSGAGGLDAEVFRARYSITPERLAEASIELGWTDGRAAIDRDTEIAVELLCEHLAAAVERLERAGPRPAGRVLPLLRKSG